MDVTARKTLDERAHRLWTEAGRPPGQEAEFRARAIAEHSGDADEASGPTTFAGGDKVA